MNKNILLVLVIVVIAVGGFVLVQSKSKTEAPTKTTIAPSATEKSPSKEAEVMSQKEDTVTLSDTGFDPKTITVKKGDKVVWLNKSGDSATVDSDNHPTHLLYPPLNMGTFKDGDNHELVFEKVGTFGYHDHFHPSKKGTVVVE